MVEFTQVVFDFIRQYGFLALFLYMLLETGMILHFAPSELVIPFAAAILVTGPLTFGLFVLVATLGSTLGSVFVYYIFDRYGVRAIDRYGRYVHIDREDLDRSQAWFGRWGENSVFWGRLLPVLRAAISIPAGLAEMEVKKFTLYSALGSLVFNTVLTYLTASSGNAKSPLELLAEWLVANSEAAAYVSANRLRIAFQLLIVLALATLVWRQREWIKTNPEAAKDIVVRVSFWVGVTSGSLLITTGFYIPREAFPLITWVWNDPQFVVSGLGVSRQIALVLSGIGLLVGAAVVLLVGRRIHLDDWSTPS